jgi:hypothetical protein
MDSKRINMLLLIAFVILLVALIADWVFRPW